VPSSPWPPGTSCSRGSARDSPRSSDLSDGAAIQLLAVDKRYRVYRERYRTLKEILIHRRLGEWQDRAALSGVTLEIPRGTTFGLIGPNGAGKSTALKLIARILVPDAGEVRVGGRVSALIELGAGFQLEYTARENIYLNASLLGLSRQEIDRRFDAIVDFAELRDHIDEPLRTYSSGMYMRLGFAVAIHVDPEVMLVDEILAVGDEAFQRKCFDWLQEFQSGGGTILMISHNLGAIRELCQQAAWLQDGKIVTSGAAGDVVDAYLDHVRDERGRQAALQALTGRRDAHAPPLEVGDVRLLDDDDREVADRVIGDPLTVDIGYRVHERVERAMVGVMVWRNDGTYVYGSNSFNDGLELGPLERDGRLRLRYTSLPLLPGTYRLTVSVFASVGEHAAPADYHEQRYSFHIHGSTPEQGVVRLEHQWQQASDPVELVAPKAQDQRRAQDERRRRQAN
jgi:ABC-type polysaccharide/polyol phosphate transport system ATPase subunit